MNAVPMTVEAAEDRRAPPRAVFLLTSAQASKLKRLTTAGMSHNQNVIRACLNAGAESRPLTSGDVDWE